MTTGSLTIGGTLARARRGIDRFGVRGVLSRGATLLGGSIARAVYAHERHVWYALDLAAPRPHVDLAPGLSLVRASAGQLEMLAELPTIGRDEARERMDAGADLWLVREGATPAFACWIFHDRTPVFAARNGWLDLPRGTVCLEDSVTAPAYRGRGIAVAAWAMIADGLVRDAVTTIVTKVAESNVPSRRAVEKTGFQPIAMMDFTRVAFHDRVTIKKYCHDFVTAFLRAALVR